MNIKFKEIAIQLFKDAHKKSILECQYWDYLEENDIDTDENYSHSDGKDSHWCLDKLFYFIEKYKAGEEYCDSFISQDFESQKSVEYFEPLYVKYIYITDYLLEAREKNDDYENKLNSKAESFLDFCIEWYYKACDDCHSNGCNSYGYIDSEEDKNNYKCKYSFLLHIPNIPKKEINWKFTLSGANTDYEFECECNNCGNSWNALDTEHFNISTCEFCFGEDIGGPVHETMPTEFMHKEKGLCEIIEYGYVEENGIHKPFHVKMSKDGVEFVCHVNDLEGDDICLEH